MPQDMSQDMQRQRILCIGSIMVDLLCSLDRLPLPGEGKVVDDRRMALGGCTYNTARIIRQAGGDCTLLAPVGVGPFADFVRARLAAEGLEPWVIEERSGARSTAEGSVASDFAGDGPNGASIADGEFVDSGVALCFLDPSGERTMVTLPGIERCFKSEWFQGVDASGYGFAEVCGYEIDGIGGEAIVAFLEQNPHMQVVFAPGPVIAHLDAGLVARINALHPIWHLNYDEAVAYTGAAFIEDAGAQLAAACGNAVVITKGSRGCWLFEGEDILHVPTTAITPVDTTGAGDAHVGALLAKRAQGAGWEESLRFANAVSGIVCQTLGAGVSDEEISAIG